MENNTAWQSSDRAERLLTPGRVFLAHFLLASSFFAPYLFRGQMLFPSMDWLDIDFPLFLFAKRGFTTGHLGLWNPYLLCGMPSASSALSPMFYPENWLLFLLPDKALFTAVSLFAFLKLSLIGAVAFLIFREEVGNRKWALLASLTYQLAGYTVWAITTDLLSLLLYFTLALYLVWSLARRSTARSYVYLTLVLAALTSCSNLMNELYAWGTALLLGTFRIWQTEQKSKRWGRLRLLAGSALTAGLIVQIRWLPAVVELLSSNRLQDLPHSGFRELSFFAARLLNPEALGVSYWTSFEMIRHLFPSLGESNVHTHSHMPHYFGALPLLLVIWGLQSESLSQRIRFWKIYFLGSLALVLSLEPLDTLFHFLIAPLYHRHSLQILLPIGFCMCLAHAGTLLETSLHGAEGRSSDLSRPAWIALALFGYPLVLWCLLIQFQWRAGLLVKLAFCLVLTVGLALRRTRASRPWIAAGAVSLCLFGLAVIGFTIDRTGGPGLFPLRLLSVTLILLITIDIFLVVRAQERTSRLVLLTLAGVAGLAAYARLAWSVPPTAAVVPPPMDQTLLLSTMGLLRFPLVAMAFFYLLSRVREGKARASWVFPVFLVLASVDLLSAFKIHGDMVMSAFWPNQAPYPPLRQLLAQNGRPVTPDFENFRAGFPNLMVSDPFYLKLHGNREELSSLFSVYGIRSYGGYVNAVPGRYSTFLQALVSRDRLYAERKVLNGFVAELTDDRALDILGVRYELSGGKIRERLDALSRFKLFSSFEMVSGTEAAAKRLKDPGFDPNRSLLLERPPGFPSEESLAPGDRLKVSVADTDHIELEVDSLTPRIVLFNDSYHPGWKAAVGEKDLPILIANGAFMGIPVPGGTSHISLHFEPRSFYFGVYGSLLGAISFLLASLALWLAEGALSGAREAWRSPGLSSSGNGRHYYRES